MSDFDASKAAYRLAARPWRQAGAAFLIPGMALLFFTVFLTHDRNAILSGIAGLMMAIGGVITFIGFAKGDAAKKKLGS